MHTLPVELVRPVLEAEILDRTDIRSCALVNRIFHAEAVAVLYRNIDLGHIIMRDGPHDQPELVHPCATILQKPWYGKHVQHFSESSDVATVDPTLLIDFLTALRLCTNLRSFTWTFPHDAPASRAERVLLEYLAVLRRLRVPRLDICGVKGALGAQVLTRLMYMGDVASIGVQTHGSDIVRAESMAAALRERLRHLEFSGRDIGSRSYVPLFSRLSGLRSLTLRNATTRDVLEIVAVLPALTVLDTHFLPCEGPEPRASPPACKLQRLTVYVAGQALRRLWTWLPQLVPNPGLLSLSVRNHSAADAPAVSARNWAVAPTFLKRVARIHAATLQELAFDAMYMTPRDLSFVCGSFIALERLMCHLTMHDMDTVGEAICGAHELRHLSVYFKSRLPRGVAMRCAERWLRREGSKLEYVTLRHDVFQGCWVYREPSDTHPGGAYYMIVRSQMDRSVYKPMAVRYT